MSSSLIPERPLIISPTLAATIGLDEAVMLQVLADVLLHSPGSIRQQRKWVELSNARLAAALPFWQSADINRVINSLMELGLLLREASAGSPASFQFAINEKVVSGAPAPASEPGTPVFKPTVEPAVNTAAVFAENAGATRMDPRWQPGADWVRQCRQQAIPEDFIQSRVPEFVRYWLDRGSAEFSWGNKFYKFVLREWRHEQSRQGARDLAPIMGSDWWPSDDALEILENAGINGAFIEDAVPEFVLYWCERDPRAGAWNSKFIEHVRRQWARFSASFGVDDVPRPIVDDWRPSAECFDILQLAEIDEEYARARVPEFVLYWKDSGQARASWNTVFLQFIKQDWARRLQSLDDAESQHAENRQFAGANQQRLKEKFQRFTDRSWAE